MNYRFLGRTGLRVSELCLGTMTFGREADEARSHALMDRFLDVGGNFIDTANVYNAGISEAIVGRWLKPHRNQIVLATKFRFAMGDGPNEIGASRYHIVRAVEASLRRLQVDHIDLYQIHCWDPRTPLEETLRALDDLVRQGKVLYLGASNYAAWHLMKALGISERLGLARFDCLQPQYSLISRQVEYELMPLCLSEGIGVIPWSPLGGGFLTGKYSRDRQPETDVRFSDREQTGSAENVWSRRATERNWSILEVVVDIASARGVSPAQVALAWLLAQPGVTSPIIGARNLRQLDDNLAARQLQLTVDELERLDTVSAPEEIYPYRFIRDMGAR